MPLYEYKCDACGDVFEVMRKFTDGPVTVHEKCGGPVHRLMSAPSFQFKGSGWYVTDYGKGGKVPAANGDTKKSESSGEPAKSGDSSSKEGSSTPAKSDNSSPSAPAPSTTSSSSSDKS